MNSDSDRLRTGLTGAFMVLSPVPFLLAVPEGHWWPAAGWQFWLAAASALLCGLCAFTLCRRPALGKWIGAGAVLTGYGTIFPLLASSPFAALAGLVCLVGIGSVLPRLRSGTMNKALANHAEQRMQRARWGAFAMLAATALWFMSASSPGGVLCCATASWIAQGLFLDWAATIRSWWRAAFAAAAMVCLGLVLSAFPAQYAAALAAGSGLTSLAILSASRHRPFDQGEPWWGILVDHPGRILITSFSLLCLAGTLLLSMPAATTRGAVAFIDAAFTSVSAVCVTGLIVLDTPNDFTFAGQLFILVLIQLGGLGIMSVTTVALHALGRRLSLRHEKLLTSMTATSHRDLIGALGNILKFTVVAETVGATCLILAFLRSGDAPAQALWRGVFTAVSAFCNAGFSLQSDSLIPYQATPLVLHVVALLIIFGGMAPATSLLIPRWLAGKTVPVSVHIALATTVVLLLGGTFFMLAFEWNGMLSGLSFGDKCLNAWFQSATLRTAGFNSLDTAAVSSPAFLMMLLFMFVGGSPGGTAGGVKTVSIGLLAMTFRTHIASHREVVIHRRRIPAESVYRAITVVAAGAAVWSLVAIMLAVTQSLPFRDLVFEATSALGTVGLSTGATPRLDEIGKVIVMIAMFAGRIGPVSLFMLLNAAGDDPGSKYPVEHVAIEG